VVQFTTDLGSLEGSTAVTRSTNADGAAVVRLSGTESGTATVSIASGDLSDAVAVTLTPGPPENVAVTLGSSEIACQASTSVRAEVRDAQGNLVADGTSVTFATDLPATLSPGSGETTDGVITSTVEGYDAGSGSVTATAEGGVSGSAGLSIIHGSPDSLAVTASPRRIEADGVEEARITARVADRCGLPVPGAEVRLATNLGTLEGSSVIERSTNDAGTATVRLTGTKSGVASISATSGGLSDRVYVTLESGPPEDVTVSLGDPAIPCGETTTVTALVRDGEGNTVVDGTRVTFTTDLPATISPVSAGTQDGWVTSIIRGHALGSGTVTATTEGGTFGTASLTITRGSPYTLTVATSPESIEADGVEQAVVTATVTDRCGALLPDVTLHFTTSLGSLAGSTTVTRSTGPAGSATVVLTGTKRGRAAITVTSDALAATTSVHLMGVIFVCEGSDCDFEVIQDAVDDASDGEEIRVAAGRYTGEGDAVVYLSKTVTLRGGYLPPDWSVPDPDAHPTILDAEEARRGLHIVGSISPTIEGVQIVDGSAEGHGGGPWWAPDAGGGIYVESAAPTIKAAQVLSSSADAGGGVYVKASDTVLADSQVLGNRAHTDWGGIGGGLYIQNGRAAVTRSVIARNSADKGGGIGVYSSYETRIENTQISENRAVSPEGDYGADNRGGGLYLSDSPILLAGSVISGNDAFYGGGMYLNASDAEVSDSDVTTNMASGGGGGVYVHNSRASLVDNEVFRNAAVAAGGGILIRVYGEDPPEATLTGNRVYTNTAEYGGGLALFDSSAHLNENWITGNRASEVGGGVYVSSYRGEPIGPVFANTMLVENAAGRPKGGGGLGVLVEAGAPHLLHTTLARNEGGGIYVWSGSAMLTNTLLVSHTVGVQVASGASARLERTLWGGAAWGNDVDWDGSGTTDVGTSGSNLWYDPQFVDPERGDYHIRALSPARDRGLDVGVTRDIDAEMRPMGRGYDLGADECAVELERVYLPLILWHAGY
jgi:uncharacterized Zn ribbon protein